MRTEVWLDVRRDGVHQADEPALPDVAVQLRTSGGSLVKTQRTDARGRVTFAGLLPGSYRTVVVPPAGLGVTRASDGGTSADVAVDVPVGEAATSWAGLVGDSGLSGEVPDAQTTELVLHWLGPDGVAGGGDDVRMVVPVVDGRFSAQGLPPGAYRLEPVDGTSLSVPATATPGDTTRVLVAAAARVNGPEPDDDALGDGATRDREQGSPGGPTATTVRASALPRTGGPVDTLAASALALLVSGAALVHRGRRRPSGA